MPKCLYCDSDNVRKCATGYLCLNCDNIPPKSEYLVIGGESYPVDIRVKDAFLELVEERNQLSKELKAEQQAISANPK